MIASLEGLAILLAPLVSAGLVLALLPLARRIGLVDVPGGRKAHAAPTPVVGGIAIFLALLAVLALQGRIPSGSLSLLAACVIAVTAGGVDDALALGHHPKFLAQILAAGIVVSGTDVIVVHLGNLVATGDIELGKWSILFTLVSIVGVMNAMNMIDGLDGLAGTVALVALAGLAVAASLAAQARLAGEIMVLAGCVMGFLFFNLRLPWQKTARVFLGDAGALLLGLLLAWYAVFLGGTRGAQLFPMTVVWIIALPLLEMGSVMMLRIFRGKNPFRGDRSHLHYVLVDAGYAPAQVVGFAAALMVGFASIGLFAQYARVSESVMFLGFMGCWLAYAVAMAYPAHTVAALGRVMLPTRGPD